LKIKFVFKICFKKGLKRRKESKKSKSKKQMGITTDDIINQPNDFNLEKFKELFKDYKNIEFMKVDWIPEIKTNSKGNKIQYIMSIFTDKATNLNDKSVDLSCIIPKFNHDLFETEFKHYWFDCEDYYHFSIIKFL
jgi:hypothetical protein